MKKLFVNHPIFRLLSPIGSGTLAYLLILLINNTIEDLAFNFFTQELYVCIGLAYLIQEFTRLIIVVFNRLKRPKSFLTKSLLHVFTTLVLSGILVTGAMYLYFIWVLSYTPNYMELLIFNSIFSTIAVLYVLLYISNQFLHKINTEKLENEELARIRMEEDFSDFKQDINPTLLMDSLESILVLMKENTDEAETLTEDFASIYRYILSSKRKELVPLEEEVSALEDFIEVLNRLPYRKLDLNTLVGAGSWVEPGSLLYICEGILRSSIPSESNRIKLNLSEDETTLQLEYRHDEKLNETFEISNLQAISDKYVHYTSKPVEIIVNKDMKTISIPKLSVE